MATMERIIVLGSDLPTARIAGDSKRCRDSCATMKEIATRMSHSPSHAETMHQTVNIDCLHEHKSHKRNKDYIIGKGEINDRILDITMNRFHLG